MERTLSEEDYFAHALSRKKITAAYDSGPS